MLLRNLRFLAALEDHLGSNTLHREQCRAYGYHIYSKKYGIKSLLQFAAYPLFRKNCINNYD